MGHQIATIVKRPYVGWYAPADKPHVLIEVQSIGTHAEIEKRGYARTWRINDIAIENPAWAEALGLDFEEFTKLLEEFLAVYNTARKAAMLRIAEKQ